jgi:glutamate synthase (NADPH) small chain
MSISITIDGCLVSVPEGTTVLEAARRLGVHVPTMCDMAGLEPWTSCFLCVVQVEGRGKLTPSCAARAEPGMIVTTDSDAIREARRTALELLLSDHRGDCVAPCTRACPTGMDVSGYVAELAAGRRREALKIIKTHNPLPGALGQVCAQYCEKVCRRRELDEPLAIRALHRQVADEDWTPDCAVSSGRRVGIVGAGPAGLSAAYHLARMGHAVTVCDDHDEPGGGLRYGADAAKGLADDLPAFHQMGIVFRTGCTVGADPTMAEFRAEHDAVVSATGETVSEEPGFVCASGGKSRNAARSVGSGRRAALRVDAFLCGEEPVDEPRAFQVSMGKLSDADRAVLGRGVEPVPRMPEDAAAEAARCLRCDCAARDDCVLRRLSEECGARGARFRGEPRAFQREESASGVVFESGKCILCGRCVRIAESRGEELGIGFRQRGMDTQVAAPFGHPVGDGLSQTMQECIDACPTGALAKKRCF